MFSLLVTLYVLEGKTKNFLSTIVEQKEPGEGLDIGTRQITDTVN
jgi:hypothetical protein